jgi:hypothetical protein
MHVVWTSLVATNYFLMHYNLPLPCVWNVEKLQTHLPKLIFIDDDYRITFKLIYLFATISRKKFVVLWNRSFLFFKDMKKKNPIACYV